MNIEVGKYYRTEAGKKAQVLAKHFNDAALHQYVGLIFGDSRWISWNHDGVSVNYSDASAPTTDKNEFNIVAEWREPRQMQLTVYLTVDVANEHLDYHISRRNCELWNCRKVIAKKTITITEGEGL